MKKILLTGPDSFVGKHLIPSLISHDYELFVLGRRADYTSYGNKHRYDLPRLNGDLADNSFLEKITFEPSVIVNLAASRDNSMLSLEQSYSSNVIAVENLLKYAKKIGCEKFIHLSSISIHGNFKEGTLDESTGIDNPGVYGYTKGLGEQHVTSASTDLKTFTIRLPAIIGKGAKDHWLAKTLNFALNNEPIYFDNPNSQFNNVVHVDDLSKFIVKLINIEDVPSCAFPIASKNPVSVGSIIKKILDTTKSSSIIHSRLVSRPTFLIDDSFARIKLSYESLDTLDAISRYVRESL